MTRKSDDASTFIPDVETVRYWCIAGTGSDANHYSAAFDRFLERAQQQAVADYLAEHRNVTREAEQMQAAFARVWDEGYAAAEHNREEVCHCAAWNEDECACWNYGNGKHATTNPYAG